MGLDSIACLGFLVKVFVSEISAGPDPGGALDNDVSVFTMANLPLTWLVSNSQSNSSYSNALPFARRQVGH